MITILSLNSQYWTAFIKYFIPFLYKKTYRINFTNLTNKLNYQWRHYNQWWHYIITLQSGLYHYTTYVENVHFIHEWWDLQLKVDSKREIFWETFHGNLMFKHRVFAINLPRRSQRQNIFFFIFSFWCLTWSLKRGLTSNKPTHYLWDYGDL